MATPYGKAVRKLRIDLGLRLKDMADELGVKPTYLSAVESGRKRITDNVLEQAVDFFEKAGAQTPHGVREMLEQLVDQSQPECTIKLADKVDRDREIVVAFARKFSDLTAEEKDSIESILDMR